MACLLLDALHLDAQPSMRPIMGPTEILEADFDSTQSLEWLSPIAAGLQRRPSSCGQCGLKRELLLGMALDSTKRYYSASGTRFLS